MPDVSRILVVAATPRELASGGDWRTLVCGVGPVDAAAATAAAIAADPPAAILHVGIAGARRQSSLAPGSLVIGIESTFPDLVYGSDAHDRVIAATPALLSAAVRVLPNAARLRIGTSARVGGSSDCDVEAMEGWGVLRAARRAGVPAIEIRAISNEVEEQDRARWHFDTAFAAITAATPDLVAEFARCVR